ncbi:NAD-dependent epimerase [Bradyrhizobium jicamae]|uniref:NAD-dependent epimerase n=1 Tax=Bradyrhizobium jicamae TaxID=280332 RepID=A0ABS5FK68_9BRAD|nr:NAD-dependent epimerase [Bradyrhizobium jicamae]MBR0797182.1 NAD-dependent epimerase [Bradyrhizobium jicamae]MBR0934905.1 NAD-dependent epimerase [Bradyrhizobium jicamae]
MIEGNLLVTGCAGFIGFHLTERLLKIGQPVVGIDNLNDYYDPALKRARLDRLEQNAGFTFLQVDLADRAETKKLFERYRFEVVLHLAAQAGVRYSLANPHAYADSNLGGFLNVLEGCRHTSCRHLLFASSSSVYGANTKLPFSVHDNVDHPVSLYAATKKANELLAHSYSHLYGLPTTGLRFFTVYGPWYRPDMALYLFADAITKGRPIDLFNNGNMRRDFTYVDDVTEAMVRLIGLAPEGDPGWSGDHPDPGSSKAPWRIYNIGNNKPEDLMHVVGLLEKEFGRQAVKRMLPMQPGDVPATYADVTDLAHDIGFRPQTRIEDGVAKFVAWYREYYRI